MRIIALVIAFLVSGCAHALSGGAATDRGFECAELDACFAGSGEADGIVSIAVASAIVGALAVATYRHLAHR